MLAAVSALGTFLALRLWPAKDPSALEHSHKICPPMIRTWSKRTKAEIDWRMISSSTMSTGTGQARIEALYLRRRPTFEGHMYLSVGVNGSNRESRDEDGKTAMGAESPMV